MVVGCLLEHNRQRNLSVRMFFLETVEVGSRGVDAGEMSMHDRAGDRGLMRVPENWHD